MQRSTAYSDAGILWVGELPGNWQVRRLAYSVHRADVKLEPEQAEGLPYVGLEHVASWTGRLLPIDDQLTPEGAANAFEVGDVLFGKLRPYLAKAVCADFDGVCSTEFLVLKSRDYERRYLLYLLLTDGFISHVDSSTYGAKMPRASWDFIGDSLLPVPPLDEQRDIAAFLDRETERIDSLIAKKRLLIERLQEYRTALITRTVTRGLPPEAARAAGLDPSPRLKPSGVEWLGDVPEHWDVRRLRFVASINDDALTDGEDPLRSISYVDISSVDATLGVTRFDEMVFEDAPSRARRLVQDGDTIVSTVRTYLRAIAPITNPKPEMVVSTGFAVVRPINLDADFASWVLREQGLVDEIVARSVGVSYPAINAPEIGNLAVPIPPVGERRAIADFLEMSTRLNDELRHQIENAIERLLEYRAALITAAVTGKIDVRGAATSGRGSVESRP